MGALEGIAVDPSTECLFAFPAREHLILVVDTLRRTAHQHPHSWLENVQAKEAGLILDCSLAFAEHLLEIFLSALFHRNVVYRNKHASKLQTISCQACLQAET